MNHFQHNNILINQVKPTHTKMFCAGVIYIYPK